MSIAVIAQCYFVISIIDTKMVHVGMLLKLSVAYQ